MYLAAMRDECGSCSVRRLHMESVEERSAVQCRSALDVSACQIVLKGDDIDPQDVWVQDYGVLGAMDRVLTHEAP